MGVYIHTCISHVWQSVYVYSPGTRTWRQVDLWVSLASQMAPGQKEKLHQKTRYTASEVEPSSLNTHMHTLTYVHMHSHMHAHTHKHTKMKVSVLFWTCRAIYLERGVGVGVLSPQQVHRYISEFNLCPTEWERDHMLQRGKEETLHPLHIPCILALQSVTRLNCHSKHFPPRTSYMLGPGGFILALLTRTSCCL